MGVNYKSLIEDYKRCGVDATTVSLREQFKKKELRPDEFDLGRLFEECFGWSEYMNCRKPYRDGGKMVSTLFRESTEVSSAAFTAIAGQIVYAQTIPKYESPEFVFTPLVPTYQAVTHGAEKIAGVTQLGNAATERNESEPYTVAGVGPNYIHSPVCKDRGLIVPVTREAIFEDKTGQLLQMAGDVGYAMGLNLEFRIIDALVDLNDGAKSAMVGGHRYHWLDTSIASYGDDSGSHTWDNLSATTALTDYTSLKACEILLSKMTDPFTGNRINMPAKHLVVCPTLLHEARAIKRAESYRVHVSGYPTTGSPVERVAPNTLDDYTIVSSAFLDQRQVTAGSGLATTWYLGDIGKALQRKIVFPMQVDQAPAGNDDEFNRQIVMKFRANETSMPFWREPRCMIKATA